MHVTFIDQKIKFDLKNGDQNTVKVFEFVMFGITNEKFSFILSTHQYKPFECSR